jgi:hypothetical protein
MTKRISTFLGLAMLSVLIIATMSWGVLAIIFLGPHHEILSYSLAAIFTIAGLIAISSLFYNRWRWHIFSAYTISFVLLLFWFFSFEPSNDRDWQTDVAVLPYATINANEVTVHNIRNFSYRSETDYTPAYYDRRFDLDKLEGIDIITVYWMGPAIAHVFLSFAFEGDQHLAISIETRKEKGESYSTLKGFFRQYELYYVVADERDVVGLRTNYRNNPPEDVYVYRAAGNIENGRRLFMEYINRINALHAKPKFYNTLTSNCTTSIWMNTQVNENRVPLSWKVLASGYLPEYLYEQGRLVTNGMTFNELRNSVHINARAHAAPLDDQFSIHIRK